MASYLRPRRGKLSTMKSKNVILKKGEIFLEVPEAGAGKGIGKIKVGDGVTEYTSLPYFLQQHITYLDETSSGATVTFTAPTDSTSTSNTNESTIYTNYIAKIVSGQKLATIIGAIRIILTAYHNKLYNMNSIIENCSSTVYVGSTAPAANTRYLLWVDTTSGNNYLKFRTSVSSTTWTQVSSVWNS